MANQSSLGIKTLIKRIPIIGSTARKLAQLPVVAAGRRLVFRGSPPYWENRYRAGGTSGAGSYGRLAAFKAEALNEFVRTKGIRSVIELGCGDGAQLALAEYPRYVGVDVAAACVERCNVRFRTDPKKSFYLATALPQDLGTFELGLSLDVVYHLVEDDVFDAYMRELFRRSERHIVIYSSNYDALTSTPHVRHRKFTSWITANAPAWQTAGFVPNRFPFDPNHPNDTSFADFHFFTRLDG
jgi:SAM-dependent methyltransferase